MEPFDYALSELRACLIKDNVADMSCEMMRQSVVVVVEIVEVREALRQRADPYCLDEDGYVC